MTVMSTDEALRGILHSQERLETAVMGDKDAGIPGLVGIAERQDIAIKELREQNTLLMELTTQNARGLRILEASQKEFQTVQKVLNKGFVSSKTIGVVVAALTFLGGFYAWVVNTGIVNRLLH